MTGSKYERDPTIPIYEAPLVDSMGDSRTVRRNDEERRKMRHDLKSPLNQIIGFSEMLQEDAEEQGLTDFVVDLKKIENAGRKLVSMIDAFVDLHANAEASHPPTHRGSRRPLLRTATPLPERPSRPTEPRRGSILAVDDDPLNREMLARRLQSLGYQVETAEDGASALLRIEQRPFDLVLLDVVMPEVSGLEVLERVRVQYDRGDLPVIMTTALDASTDVVEALRLGANDYVTKPLDMAVVVARIDSQLGLKQARDKVRELSVRLEAAQSRVASMADRSAGLDGDASAWARSIAREVSDAVGQAEVAVWLFRDERFEQLTDSKFATPVAAELEAIRFEGRTYRQSEALLAVSGLSGRLLGVIGVGIGQDAFGEAEELLVQNFARHLGSVLELGEMRKELARTAEQRRATEEQLIARGVDLVHLCPVCQRCYPHSTTHCEDDGTSVHPQIRPLPYRVRQRYRLERLIGEGGMGTVFRAFDERLGRVVAVKLIKPDLFHNDTVRLRFEQEARAVARIDHPSVISIFDSGEAEEGSQYMVMEWLSGNDLGQVLQKQGPGTPQQVASFLRQAGGALGAAHGARLVHRDIKPDNIFVHHTDGNLRIKVLDFGVAKEMATATHLTQTGSLIGTPLYMSPEQVMNQPIDVRSDIYSFATVAFEALTGERTVNVEHFAEVVLAVASQEAPRLSQKLPDVSAELDRAFARGLAKNPSARPSAIEQWATEVADLLDAVPPAHAGWKF